MASALEVAQKAILARIAGNIPAGLAAERIQGPNAPFTPPAVNASGTAALWAKIDLLWGDGFATTIGAVGSGAARNTVVGVLQISVFGPAGKGGADVNAIVDKFRDLFNRQAFGGVRCEVASGPSPAENPDSAWWQRILRVPFSVDELQ